MTSFDFLPREEPGRPLYHLPPGFADHVMQEIRMREHRRKAKRVSAILALGFCAIVLAHLTIGSYAPAMHYEIPVARVKPRPVPLPVTAPTREPVRIAKAIDQSSYAPQVQTGPVRSPERMVVTVTPPVDPALKKKLDVVHTTRNLHKLAEMARREPSLQVRLEAISELGMIGGEESNGYLVDLYPYEQEREAKERIVMTLLGRYDTESVEKLESMETNPAARGHIADMLTSYRAARKGQQEPPAQPARNRHPR